MKKIISIIISMVMLAVTMPSVAFGTENNLEIGTYFQMGKYNGEPILWRYMADDDNGKLMVSDKIICFKAFDVGEKADYKQGSNLWEETTIRRWLNSVDSANNIIWPRNYAPTADKIRTNGPYMRGDHGKYPYADEAGFLNQQNFSDNELGLIRSATQWQMLPENKVELATNGETRPYLSAYTFGSNREPRTAHFNTISELNEAFRGAMYQVTDTMFLLNENHIYKMWQNFGIVGAKRTDLSVSDEANDNAYYDYWLTTPAIDRVGYYFPSYDIVTTIEDENTYFVATVNMNELGVRPAFYLNDDNMQILSGSGTETDPYVITGSEQVETPVFCNGEQLQFDQQPIEENDRLLVPVRAIFEKLGAEVTYDDGDGVITANDGERTVVMQVDNDQMGNGTEVFTLDVAPKIVGDRTVVPLRAVSEAFDAKVDYIEDLNRVVVDKLPAPTHDPNWAPSWYEEAFRSWGNKY